MATALISENRRQVVAQYTSVFVQPVELSVQLTRVGNIDADPIRNSGPVPGSCSIGPHK
jgi:hypothetical protein